MTVLFILFWTLMIFGSIAWYGFLLFYVGIKGGGEVIRLTRTLGAQPREGQSPDREK